MRLDVFTIQAVTLFVAFTGGWLLLLAWLQNRRVASLAFWGAGCIVASSGEFLMMWQGLPAFFTADLAGAMVLLGYGLIWSGLRHFRGGVIVLWLALGPAALWMLVCRLGWSMPPSGEHIVVLLMSATLYLLASVVEVWRSDRDLISRWPMVIFLLAKASAYITAATLQHRLPPPLGNAATVPNWAVPIYLAFLLIVCALIFLAISMAKERIELFHRRSASIDALTGVANRRAFFEVGKQMLEHTLANNKPLAVLLMDLDFFKRINDTQGQQAGDRVLRSFCEAVRATVRAGDHFGRLGGEEFACLLPGANDAQAHLIAERIRIQCEDRVVRAYEHEHEHGTTVSIGVVVASDPGQTLDTLLADANIALHHAKAKGRNRVEHVTPSEAALDSFQTQQAFAQFGRL